MLTLREAYQNRYKFKKTGGSYGMEIETETPEQDVWPEGFFEGVPDEQTGETKYKIPMDNWEGHYDGSLRNFGMEFVFKKPLSYKKSLSALDTFGTVLKDIPFIKGAPSTSVHVHVNMLDETLLTMANFIATYVLVENVLIEYSGESRRSNLFALPIRVARVTLDNLILLIQNIAEGSDRALIFNQHSVKYAAINLGRLSSFGSLELRMFRGEVDHEENKLWLTIIDDIMNFSRQEGMTPRDILKGLSVKSHDEILSSIFVRTHETIRERVPDFKKLIVKNYLHFANFATCVPDWTRLSEKLEETSQKPDVPEKTKVSNSPLDFTLTAEIQDEYVDTPSLEEDIDDDSDF